jgi:hypothetical protein
MMRLELKSKEARPGEKVSGQALWSADKGKSPRKIVVAMRWVLQGKGWTEETVVEMVVEKDLATKTEVVMPFEWEVPAVGPTTYEGRLFRIDWSVIARAHLPAVFDDTATANLIVVPGAWSSERLRSFEKPPQKERNDEEDYLLLHQDDQ